MPPWPYPLLTEGIKAPAAAHLFFKGSCIQHPRGLIVLTTGGSNAPVAAPNSNGGQHSPRCRAFIFKGFTQYSRGLIVLTMGGSNGPHGRSK